MRGLTILAFTSLLCGACDLQTTEPPLPPWPNGVCNPELTAAIRAGNGKQVDGLIARNAMVRCKEPIVGDPERVRPWTTPLELAVETGQVALVKSVLAAGAEAGNHETEVPAVYRAVRMKRPDLLNLLLQAGASANSHSGNPVLREAIKSGDAPIVRILLEHGADPNKRWWSELMPDAYFERSPPSSECLITPLMEAAARGSEELVRLLLTAGAKRSDHDCKGQTARDYALRHGHSSIGDALSE